MTREHSPHRNKLLLLYYLKLGPSNCSTSRLPGCKSMKLLELHAFWLLVENDISINNEIEILDQQKSIIRSKVTIGYRVKQSKRSDGSPKPLQFFEKHSFFHSNVDYPSFRKKGSYRWNADSLSKGFIRFLTVLLKTSILRSVAQQIRLFLPIPRNPVVGARCQPSAITIVGNQICKSIRNSDLVSWM